MSPEPLVITRSFPRPLIITLLAGLYILTGKLGLMLALVHPSATAVWPPTGIALAAFLIFGPRIWPGILVAAFLVNVTTAGSIATSIGIAVGNTLEGLIGATLVQRFARGRLCFRRAADTFRFAVLAGLLGTAISATIGVSSLVLGGFANGADFGRIWFTWWLGDLGGALVVAPLIILWTQPGRGSWDRRAGLEAAVVLVALLAIGVAAFNPVPPFGRGGYPLKFACMPALIWIAFRFDQRTTASATLLLAVVAVWGTVASTWAMPPDERNETLQVLQVFLAVTSAATLVLSAAVAERTRAETQLRAISEDLRAAMSELEAFSHSLSHDLRSPISAILNFTTILEQDAHGRLGEDSMGMLRRMRNSAESAARLLDQLVQFAWVERQKGGATEVDMTSLARAAYAEVATGSESTVTVRLELHDLPSARGNGALLGRVFSNLLSNAIKYTRRRPDPRIVVTGERGSLENTYCVADNGTGFDPQSAEQLFQPFRRDRPRPDVDGSGLGLAIVARIIRRHGGRVWAESDGANGARFLFTVPNDVPWAEADRPTRIA